MNKYKIWCETDSKWEEVISSTAPTSCPINNTHTIKSDSVVVTKTDVAINDGTLKDLTLDDYKRLRLNEIDLKTRELISQPFIYDSNNFSTSEAAQRNWIAIYVFKDVLTYPVYVSTDDDGEYSLADQAALTNMVLTGLSWVQGAYGSGRALKIQVKAATTEAEVDAVVDNR